MFHPLTLANCCFPLLRLERSAKLHLVAFSHATENAAEAPPLPRPFCPGEEARLGAHRALSDGGFKEQPRPHQASHRPVTL